MRRGYSSVRRRDSGIAGGMIGSADAGGTPPESVAVGKAGKGMNACVGWGGEEVSSTAGSSSCAGASPGVAGGAPQAKTVSEITTRNTSAAPVRVRDCQEFIPSLPNRNSTRRELGVASPKARSAEPGFHAPKANTPRSGAGWISSESSRQLPVGFFSPCTSSTFDHGISPPIRTFGGDLPPHRYSRGGSIALMTLYSTGIS